MTTSNRHKDTNKALNKMNHEKIDKEDGDIFSPSKLDDDFQILETQPKKG